MYNKNKIKTQMLTLVGWRETAQAGTSCYGSLTTSLKTSDSILYINDLSKVTLELVNEIHDEDYANVNDYLDDVQEYGLFYALDKFINAQKNNVNTKELIHNLALGINGQDRSRTITPMNRFVGYEVTPRRSNSVEAEVYQLGLNFTGAVTDLNIYFYAGSQIDAVKVFQVTTAKGGMNWISLATETSGSGSVSDNSTQVSIPEVLAQYISDENQVGDRYFIGYYETDLVAQGVQAIKGNGGCGCSASDSKYTKWVTVQPIEVSSGDTFVTRDAFYPEKVGISGETFGLSVKINVKCSMTNIILQNKLMFANLMRFAIGSKILWDAYGSNRLNAVKNLSKEDARLMAEKYEVEFMEELKVLNIDFSDIDKECIGKANNVFGMFGF